MEWMLVIGLALLGAVFLLLEMRGARLTLQLSFKGDLKRETAFLAQYGQSVATPIAAWLVAIAKGHDLPTQARWFALVCLPVIVASITCVIFKRSLGRMRPNRENAGRFTGFSFRQDNKRESFPSSHSACAFALTLALVHVWPQAASVFWTLAFITALLRYLLDAHYPSDILLGSMLGIVISRVTLLGFESLVPLS